jgi:hypothetical protein
VRGDVGRPGTPYRRVTVRAVESPEINDPVLLRDDQREYRSRVEDLAPGVVTVARPFDLPAEHGYGVGAELQVSWSCPRGIAVLPTRLVETRVENGLGLWVLEVVRDGWIEQRRRHVRVPVTGPVSLVGRGDEPVGAVTVHFVDVSEGALRCTVETGETGDVLVEDVEVTARFRLGEGDFVVPGRILHRRAPSRPGEKAQVVVLFDEPVTSADALRKEIFAQQLRNRRARSDG